MDPLTGAFIVFLVLKLVGVIGWSWWWVTAPLWGAVAGVIAVLTLGAGGIFGFSWLANRG